MTKGARPQNASQLAFSYDPKNLIVRHNEKYWYRGEVVATDARLDPPQVRVAFRGYPPSDDTWLPYDSSRLATYDPKRFKSAGNYAYTMLNADKDRHAKQPAGCAREGGGSKGEEAAPTSSNKTRGRQASSAKGASSSKGEAPASQQQQQEEDAAPVTVQGAPAQPVDSVKGETATEPAVAEEGAAAQPGNSAEGGAAPPPAGDSMAQPAAKGANAESAAVGHATEGMAADTAADPTAAEEEKGTAAEPMELDAPAQQAADASGEAGWESEDQRPASSPPTAVSEEHDATGAPGGLVSPRAQHNWACAQPSGPFVALYPAIEEAHRSRPFHTLAAAMLLHGMLAWGVGGGERGHEAAWRLTAAFLRSVVGGETVRRLLLAAAGYAAAAEAALGPPVSAAAAAEAGGGGGSGSEKGSRDVAAAPSSSQPPQAHASQPTQAQPTQAQPTQPQPTQPQPTQPQPTQAQPTQPQPASQLLPAAPAAAPAKPALGMGLRRRAAGAVGTPGGSMPGHPAASRKRKQHPDEAAGGRGGGRAKGGAWRGGRASRGRGGGRGGSRTPPPSSPAALKAAGNQLLALLSVGEGVQQRESSRDRAGPKGGGSGQAGPLLKKRGREELARGPAGMAPSHQQVRPLSSFIMAPTIAHWGERRQRTKTPQRSLLPADMLGPHGGYGGHRPGDDAYGAPPALAHALMDLARAPTKRPSPGASAKVGDDPDLASEWQCLWDERKALKKDQAEFRHLVNTFASLLLPPPGSTKTSPLLELMAADPSAHAALHSLLSKVLGLDHQQVSQPPRQQTQQQPQPQQQQQQPQQAPSGGVHRHPSIAGGGIGPPLPHVQVPGAAMGNPTHVSPLQGRPGVAGLGPRVRPASGSSAAGMVPPHAAYHPQPGPRPQDPPMAAAAAPGAAGYGPDPYGRGYSASAPIRPPPAVQPGVRMAPYSPGGLGPRPPQQYQHPQQYHQPPQQQQQQQLLSGVGPLPYPHGSARPPTGMAGRPPQLVQPGIVQPGGRGGHMYSRRLNPGPGPAGAGMPPAPMNSAAPQGMGGPVTQQMQQQGPPHLVGPLGAPGPRPPPPAPSLGTVNKTLISQSTSVPLRPSATTTAAAGMTQPGGGGQWSSAASPSMPPGAMPYPQQQQQRVAAPQQAGAGISPYSAPPPGGRGPLPPTQRPSPPPPAHTTAHARQMAGYGPPAGVPRPGGPPGGATAGGSGDSPPSQLSPRSLSRLLGGQEGASLPNRILEAIRGLTPLLDQGFAAGGGGVQHNPGAGPRASAAPHPKQPSSQPQPAQRVHPQSGPVPAPQAQQGQGKGAPPLRPASSQMQRQHPPQQAQQAHQLQQQAQQQARGPLRQQHAGLAEVVQEMGGPAVLQDFLSRLPLSDNLAQEIRNVLARHEQRAQAQAQPPGSAPGVAPHPVPPPQPRPPVVTMGSLATWVGPEDGRQPPPRDYSRTVTTGPIPVGSRRTPQEDGMRAYGRAAPMPGGAPLPRIVAHGASAPGAGAAAAAHGAEQPAPAPASAPAPAAPPAKRAGAPEQPSHAAPAPPPGSRPPGGRGPHDASRAGLPSPTHPPASTGAAGKQPRAAVGAAPAAPVPRRASPQSTGPSPTPALPTGHQAGTASSPTFPAGGAWLPLSQLLQQAKAGGGQLPSPASAGKLSPGSAAVQSVAQAMQHVGPAQVVHRQLPPIRTGSGVQVPSSSPELRQQGQPKQQPKLQLTQAQQRQNQVMVPLSLAQALARLSEGTNLPGGAAAAAAALLAEVVRAQPAVPAEGPASQDTVSLLGDGNPAAGPGGACDPAPGEPKGMEVTSAPSPAPAPAAASLAPAELSPAGLAAASGVGAGAAPPWEVEVVVIDEGDEEEGPPADVAAAPQLRQLQEELERPQQLQEPAAVDVAVAGVDAAEDLGVQGEGQQQEGGMAAPELAVGDVAADAAVAGAVGVDGGEAAPTAGVGGDGEAYMAVVEAIFAEARAPSVGGGDDAAMGEEGTVPIAPTPPAEGGDGVALGAEDVLGAARAAPLEGGDDVAMGGQGADAAASVPLVDGGGDVAMEDAAEAAVEG